MDSHLIKLSDSLAVNPAHVAYADRDPRGGATYLHMVIEPQKVIVLTPEEAAAWWAAVAKLAGGA